MRSLWPTGGLWRHADFLKLWSAETVSQFGSQVGQLALPLVAILVLDASAFEVAALTTRRVPARSSSSRCRRACGSTGCRRRPILIAGRLRACCASRDDSDRVPRRRTDARPALRRRVPRRASARSSSTSPTSRTCPRSSSASRSSRATRSSRSAARRRRSAGPGSAASSSSSSPPRTPSSSTPSASSAPGSSSSGSATRSLGRRSSPSTARRRACGTS